LTDMGKSFGDADENDVYDFMNEIWLSESYEQLMEQILGSISCAVPKSTVALDFQ